MDAWITHTLQHTRHHHERHAQRHNVWTGGRTDGQTRRQTWNDIIDIYADLRRIDYEQACLLLVCVPVRRTTMISTDTL